MCASVIEDSVIEDICFQARSWVESWDAQIVLQQFLQIHEQWVRIFDGASHSAVYRSTTCSKQSYIIEQHHLWEYWKMNLRAVQIVISFAMLPSLLFVNESNVVKYLLSALFFSFENSTFAQYHVLRWHACNIYVTSSLGIASTKGWYTPVALLNRLVFAPIVKPVSRIATSFALLVKSVDKFSY